MLSEAEIIEFRKSLLLWFGHAQRDLPWRRTRDPYAIWVSEAMLQQTRVAAVLPYYERFLQSLPDYTSLAHAPESELLALWAGLGYYYRARNLQKAAQQIWRQGAFPSCYDRLLALPGIGDYTAAAVASIAFDLPHAVLDGNVLRVLARVYADDTNIASVKGRKHFSSLAESLLHREQPGSFNQAMMELGATICSNKNPQCLVCPVSDFCGARKRGTQRSLPIKLSRQKSVREDRILLWIEQEGSILAWQRPADSKLMPGFWELPEPTQLDAVAAVEAIGSFRHSITFHDYSFQIVEAKPPSDIGNHQWLRIDDLTSFPISTVFRKAARMATRYRLREDHKKVAAAGAPAG